MTFALFICSIKILDYSVTASYQLFQKLLDKLPIYSKEQHVTDSIMVVISAILYSTHLLQSCEKERSEHIISMDPAEEVQNILQKFLNRNYGLTPRFIFDSPKEMKVIKCHVVQ